MAAVNGGSLEDCHSNAFALTELNGLKWRCFVTPANTPRGVPIPSDCVLKAYGKCLQQGIICTWRRKPPTPTGQPEALQIPSFTNDISKELWVFWFGQEPENMTGFTSSLEQINNEDGAEVSSAPIPYEVRILFFKALHTVIERQLMKLGILRIGHWFTKPLRQPMSGRHHLTPQYCMAFNMRFFVHGGNTVCATYNPQRQPTLIRLAKRHLDCGKRVQVILAPWSLRGNVLPPSDAGEPSRGQGSAATQYEEWKAFFDLEVECEDSEDEGPKTEEGLPKMVTVEITGVRMLYPTPLICLTLDEDVICQKAEASSRNHSPMTPDELKVDGTKRRNPLLISEISASSHFQGVIQSVHVSRRQQPPPISGESGFREPFPVQADDDTKWNFVDPGRSDNCRCELCAKKSPQAQNAGQEAPSPSPEVNTRNVEILSTILRRQNKRKANFIYHRRWKGEARDASPPVSPTRSSTDDEDEIPEWASLNKNNTKIGIFISGEPTTPYGVASPNSSDDENFVCSPFTPVKCISPCTNCEWPSAPAEQIPEPIFCQIFQPGTSTPIPDASQEERAKVYDYYYNPTLREDPYYMSYHNRRQGEKRRSSYPPPMTMQPSPDQPGSQETIPATTSPPPELNPDSKDGENSVMSRMGNLSVSMDTGIDEFAACIPILKKKLNKVDWNDVKSVDWSCSLNEEDVPSIDAHIGYAMADDDESHDVVEEEEKVLEYNPLDASTSVEFMEVDASVESILSPPASNEQPVSWQRVGGPPSVPDAAMNQIYPTPPSVQVQIKQEPDEEPMETNIEPPEFELVASEPDEVPLSDDTKVHGMLFKLDGTPVRRTKEKVEISANDRFSSELEQKMNRLLRPKKDMPPDYQKFLRQFSSGSAQKNYFEAPVATPPAVAACSHFHSNMTPIGQIQQNTSYTLSFVPGAVQATTPGHGFPPFGPGRPGMRQMPPGYATPNPYQMGYGGPNMPPNQMPGQMGNYMNPMYPPMGQQMGPMGMGGPPMSMVPPGPMGPPMNGMGPPMGQGPQMGIYGQGQMMPPGPPMMNPYSMDSNMMPPMPPGYMGNQYGMNNPMQPMRPQHLPVMNSTAPSMYMPGNPMMAQQKPLQPPVPVEKAVPEASSIVLAIILQDTILDLHYDSAFDACPICSCNVTIRTTELGLYISPPDVLRLPAHQQQSQIPQWSGFASSGGHSNTCTCGFSSVRHRYLSFHSGLFPEDAKEATGIVEQAITPVTSSLTEDPKIVAMSKCFLDSSNNNDRHVLNQLRMMCLRSSVGKIINHLSVFAESVDKGFRPQDEGADIGSNAEYVVSQIDSTELLLLGNSVVDLAMTPNRALGANKETPTAYTNFFHQWGLQVANEIREPREAEWRALLSEISPALETSMKIVRCATGPASIVEGPLTWKTLSSKRQKASQTKEIDDDSFLPEPIPQVLIATDKDLIRASPQVVRMWEQLSLGPVDQPKDVLYLTVIPDNLTVHEKTVKYMEQLSQLYERMRLGRHIPLCAGEIRDGIVRAGGRSSIGSRPNHNFGFLDLIDKRLDDRVLISRLRLYTQQLEETIGKVLREHEKIFLRDDYREQIAFDNRAKKNAVAAIVAAAERMLSERTETTPSDAAPPGSVGTSSIKEEGAGTRSARSSSALEELLQSDNVPTSSASSSAPIGATADNPTLEPEEIPQDDFGALPHVIVIYMVNPFTWDAESRSSINARVAMLALIRAFNAVASHVKPQNRTQLHLEIISLEQIADMMGMCPDYMNDARSFTDIMQKGYLDGRDPELVEKHGSLDTLKSTALSVYSAPRILTPECVRSIGARSMTRFGPGAHIINEVNDWQRQQNLMLYNIPSCPFYLAPHPSLIQDPQSGKVIQLPNDELVLNVTYCLIGGDFLCAAITDEQGRLMDNCLINIRPKQQSHYRYRAGSQILDAIFRLMAYIQGVITMEVRSWRLVIGRLGKMGHGEFKAWNYFLSKSYLRKLSSKPKENCNACFSTAGTAGMPTILSACLISIEPEPFLRVFPSYFSPDSKNKTKQLATPGDISATHIMVFTMNTSIDFSTTDQAIEHDDVGFDDFTFADDLGDEFQNILGDVGSSEMDTSDGGSNQRMYTKGSGIGGMEMSFLDQSGSESVQNQPLASGFYVSTAPAADLPDWFWASCPSAKRRSPVHLKASLHINNQSAGGDDQGDEFMSSSKTTHKQDGNLEVVHPLDSQRTDEVLRHVLETYNALSWLNVDATTGDRQSCLPVHIQSLLRLYHSVARVYF